MTTLIFDELQVEITGRSDMGTRPGNVVGFDLTHGEAAQIGGDADLFPV